MNDEDILTEANENLRKELTEEKKINKALRKELNNFIYLKAFLKEDLITTIGVYARVVISITAIVSVVLGLVYTGVLLNSIPSDTKAFCNPDNRESVFMLQTGKEWKLKNLVTLTRHGETITRHCYQMVE